MTKKVFTVWNSTYVKDDFEHPDHSQQDATESLVALRITVASNCSPSGSISPQLSKKRC